MEIEQHLMPLAKLYRQMTPVEQQGLWQLLEQLMLQTAQPQQSTLPTHPVSTPLPPVSSVPLVNNSQLVAQQQFQQTGMLPRKAPRSPSARLQSALRQVTELSALDPSNQLLRQSLGTVQAQITRMAQQEQGLAV